MTNEERARRLRFVGELNNLCQRYGLALVADTAELASCYDVVAIKRSDYRAYAPDVCATLVTFEGELCPEPASHHTPDEPSPKG